MYVECLEHLDNKASFSRLDFQRALSLSESYANKLLQKLLKDGKIARVGRNQYQVLEDEKNVYQYDYSDLVKDVACLIQECHPYLDFVIFELVQLNYFANHLYGQNTVFVYVEDELEDYVFQTLAEKYPGKVLIMPREEDYHRYVSDNSIVILKLTSESPKGKPVKWHTRLEKLIVDLFTEQLLIETVSPREYPTILEGIFDKYAIDETCLFRYARRRGAEQKIRSYISNETKVKLRTEKRNA